MTRSRRRAVVLIHYAAIVVLAALTSTGALPYRVFVALFAVPAVALFGVERLVLGGLSMRTAGALDEREHALVAEAHRVGHRISMVLAAVLAVVALIVGALSSAGADPVLLGVSALALLAVFVSLPAGVVLWTAPTPLEEPEGAAA